MHFLLACIVPARVRWPTHVQQALLAPLRTVGVHFQSIQRSSQSLLNMYGPPDMCSDSMCSSIVRDPFSVMNCVLFNSVVNIVQTEVPKKTRSRCMPNGNNSFVVNALSARGSIINGLGMAQPPMQCGHGEM